MSTKSFSRELLKEIDAIQLDNNELQSRPQINGITIDSETSRDLDDGFDVFKTEDGYMLQVSIADVASIVKPDTPIYNIAMEKAETRYYKNSNDPMIPRALSEDKLSLVPKGMRPAITFETHLSKDYEVRNFRIFESTFNNVRRMSYKSFDKVLKSAPEDPDYNKFRLMVQLANEIYEKRKNKGALAIYDLIKGVYTDEEGTLQKFDKEAKYQSSIVVQEFMILTNVVFAVYCAEKDIPVLFRNHTVRSSAPPRDQLMEQINTLLSSSDYAATMQHRTKLWFNRAEYSPVLLGHFGLNEPAYTHVTSPIRRAADLINHIQIKEYIRGNSPKFKQEELLTIGESIQAILNEHKDETISFFKERAMDDAKNKIGKMDSSDLLKLNEKDFEQLLKGALKSEAVDSNLMEVCKARLSQNNILINILYDLMFRIEEPIKDAWKEVTGHTLEHIFNNRHTGLQILRIAEQKSDLVNELTIEHDGQMNDFSATVTVASESKDKLSATGKGRSKKEAEQYAAYALLCVMNGLPPKENIIPEPEVPSKKNDLPNTSGNKAIEENIAVDPETGNNSKFIILINNIVMKFAEISEPEYNFEVKGESHAPVFECHATIRLNDEVLEGSSTGKSKKDAKANAAKMLFQELFYKGYTDLNKEGNDPAKKISENYVGILQEHLAKAGYEAPQYEYELISPDRTNYRCTVKANIGDKNAYARAGGRNTKQAKQHAAKKFLKQILNYRFPPDKKGNL